MPSENHNKKAVGFVEPEKDFWWFQLNVFHVEPGSLLGSGTFVRFPRHVADRIANTPEEATLLPELVKPKFTLVKMMNRGDRELCGPGLRRPRAGANKRTIRGYSINGVFLFLGVFFHNFPNQFQNSIEF